VIEGGPQRNGGATHESANIQWNGWTGVELRSCLAFQYQGILM